MTLIRWCYNNFEGDLGDIALIYPLADKITLKILLEKHICAISVICGKPEPTNPVLL